MRILLLALVLFASESLMAQVTGYVDRVDKQSGGAVVRGWACVIGLNQNIEVRVFAGGAAGRGRMIARSVTNGASSSKIHSRCKTPGHRRHRFNIFIPKANFSNQENALVYVHGINPRGSNLLINRSGSHRLPTYPRTLHNVGFLADVSFSKGITVKDPQINSVFTGEIYSLNGHRCERYRNTWTGRTHQLHFGNSNPNRYTPLWTMGQWDSKVNLLPNQGYRINQGTFGWENPYKVFQIGKVGHGHRTLFMGINGQREYNNRWPGNGDPCVETPHPHMLVEQHIPATADRSLGSLQKLLFTLKGRVLTNSLTASLRSGWNKNTSTSHFKVHINIQNIRADRDTSKGHGQSFGIGINYFDVRNRNTDYQEKVFFHRPRRRIMLDLAVDSLGTNVRSSLHSGGWGNINRKDILPHIKRAFQIAINQGKSNNAVDRLKSENLNDYYITSFNMGWEVSSLHVVEMQISDVELFGQKY